VSKADDQRSSPKGSLKHQRTGEVALAEHSVIAIDSATPRIASRPIANRKVTTEKIERPGTMRPPAALLCGLVVPGQEARLDSATTRAGALETGLHFHFGNSLVSVRSDWQDTVVEYRNRENEKRGAYPFSNEADSQYSTSANGSMPAIERGAANAKKNRVRRTLKEALGCSRQVEVQAKPKKEWLH
jgi:hypothetical protein